MTTIAETYAAEVADLRAANTALENALATFISGEDEDEEYGELSAAYHAAARLEETACELGAALSERLNELEEKECAARLEETSCELGAALSERLNELEEE